MSDRHASQVLPPVDAPLTVCWSFERGTHPEGMVYV